MITGKTEEGQISPYHADHETFEIIAMKLPNLVHYYCSVLPAKHTKFHRIMLFLIQKTCIELLFSLKQSSFQGQMHFKND